MIAPPDSVIVIWALAVVAAGGLATAAYFFKGAFRMMLALDSRLRQFQLDMTARVAVLEDRTGIPHRRSDDIREGLSA